MQVLWIKFCNSKKDMQRDRGILLISIPGSNLIITHLWSCCMLIDSYISMRFTWVQNIYKLSYIYIVENLKFIFNFIDQLVS